MVLVEEGLSLPFDAGHHGGGILGDDLRILGIAFIRPPPAIVAGDGDGRGERPVHAGGADLGGCRLADASDQIGIMGGAQADIMRKQRSAKDIVVAVDGV